MKPVMIEYERKFNLGDYESETIKVHIHLDGVPGEAQKAIEGAKLLIEQYRTQRNAPAVERNY